MAELRATKRNALLGLLADALSPVADYLSTSTNPVEDTGSDLSLTGLLGDTINPLAVTADRLSYGEPLTTGRGMTRQMRPETRDALLAVSPSGLGAKAAGRGAVATGKAISPQVEKTLMDFMRQQGGLKDIIAPDDRLFVQHNLTPSKLYAADRLGGMPVPSLAVSKAGSPLENFGDITLIGRPEMAKPSASNPVFRSDAYTKRKPAIETTIDSKGMKALAKALNTNEYDVRYIADKINDPSALRYEQPMQEAYLKSIGALPDKSSMNNWEYQNAVSNMTLADKGFDSFISGFQKSLPDIGVNPKERIFKGYTYAGDRRYAPATLENIVRAMKGGAGDEGFNYGLGTVRSVAQPKFRTFEQVKNARNQILTPEKFEPVRKSLDEEFGNVVSLLGESGRYDPSDALMIAAETKRPSELRRLYPEISDEAYSKATGLLQKISDPTLPTEYFEIKPQRAMQLNEFAGALLPGDIDDATIDLLRRAGLTDLSFYDKLDPLSRRKMLEKFNPQMFSVAPAGLLGLQDEEFNQ